MTFLLLAIAQQSLASNIAIRPVKVLFDEQNKTAVLTISNRSDEPTVFQSSFKEWQLIGGESHFTDTDDIVASPPIFTVPSNSTQTIRLAILAKPAEIERSYRLFLEQIPSSSETGQLQGLKVAMNFSLPVFLAPAIGNAEQGEITWKVQHQPGHQFFVQAKNNTRLHAPISEVGLFDESQTLITQQTKHQYLLPGSTLYWELDCPDFYELPEFVQARLGADIILYKINNAPE